MIKIQTTLPKEKRKAKKAPKKVEEPKAKPTEE